MGLFSRSSTTSNTYTGLGDAQYEGLKGGIGIAAAGEEAATGLYKPLGDIQTGVNTANTGIDTANTGITGLATDIAGVNTNVDTGFTNISNLLDQYNTGINTQFDTVNTGIGNNATAMQTANQGITGLQASQDTGFADVGGRFDTVDQANTNMQTTVDQGFQDQAQGFTDVNANMSSGFADNATAMDTGFAAAGTAMDTGFGDAAAERTAAQAAALAGQQGLGTQLNTLGDNADIYATQSLENQAALQSGQDGFVSSFDTYVDRYSDDAKLAQTTRSDMQTADAAASQRLREDMARSAQTQTQQIDRVGQEVAQVKTAQLKAATTSAVADDRLDNNIRQQFADLSTSFDNDGNLVGQSVDGAGNTTRRSFDTSGNLNLATFDAQGQLTGQRQMSINSALANLQAYEVANENSNRINSLTPATSQRGSGIYANTRS